jgi:phosphoribosyl 1,2-cyclic phosphate phosphodiesterase
MEIYANTLTETAIRREFAYIFSEQNYPGLPKVNMNSISTAPFMVGDIPIIPIMVYHLKMPVLGFRFGSFTYITDANEVTVEEKEKIAGSKVLVVNALRNQKHVSHFTLDEARSLVDELEIPTGYFTHMSHQLGKHADINQALPSNRQLAWDGLELHVSDTL